MQTMREKRATSAFNASNAAVENIPLGQPILVGHHSEKAHRRAIEQSNNAMSRCVRESEKAAYYRQKAGAVENNVNIYLEDVDAIERLEAKIADLTKVQEQMKASNKIVRAKSMSGIEKIEALVNLGLSSHRANQIVGGKIIFPGYALTNNNAKINAAKDNKCINQDPAHQKQSVTIEGFVCRDEFGVHLFGKEPERVAECGWGQYPGHTLGIDLPTESFLDLKWEDEPLKVKVMIEEI